MHLEKAHTAKNLQSGFYEVPHPQIPGEQDEYLQKMSAAAGATADDAPWLL